ncbi:5-hydroxytryptamine receptor 2B-like, partial [Actinia tenebrosa]|uniref:5-hydroxytryptamine receptor 2B-like n=1 Tax=Actinia tenebrosa TaxID=6105 RepID=A0A6P8J7T3_ACTTE
KKKDTGSPVTTGSPTNGSLGCLVVCIIDPLLLGWLAVIILPQSRQELTMNVSTASSKNETEIMTQVLNLTETAASSFVVQYNLETSFLVITILNSILVFPALIGNFCIVFAIKRTPVLQTPSNFLLCSLAVSDICVGLFALPLRISRTATILLKLDELESKIHPFTLFASIYLSGVSVFTITAISVDRFLSLCLHLRYAELVTSKRISLVIIKIWISVVPFTLTYHWNHELFQSISAIATTILLIIVVICYLCIYRIVRRHQRQIQSLCNIQPTVDLKRIENEVEKDNSGQITLQKQEILSPSRTLAELSCDKDARTNASRSKQAISRESRDESKGENEQPVKNMPPQLNLSSLKKTILSSFYISILFFVCSFPYLVSKVCLAAFGRKKWTIENNEIAITIIFASSALNPFIYCTKMRSLRVAVYKIYLDFIK